MVHCLCLYGEVHGQVNLVAVVVVAVAVATVEEHSVQLRERGRGDLFLFHILSRGSNRRCLVI